LRVAVNVVIVPASIGGSFIAAGWLPGPGLQAAATTHSAAKQEQVRMRAQHCRRRVPETSRLDCAGNTRTGGHSRPLAKTWISAGGAFS
jgi:hypothetical protein